MGLSIEQQCSLSIQTIDEEIVQFKSNLRNSTIKIDELDQIDSKIQQAIMDLQEKIKVLDSSQGKRRCLSVSVRNLATITVLNVSSGLFTIGTLACATFGTTPLVRYGGFFFGTLAAGATSTATWYSSKISLDSEQKKEWIKLSQERMDHAALFRKFIKSFRKIKKEECEELKHSVRKLGRTKDRLIKEGSLYMESSLEVESMLTLSPPRFIEPIQLSIPSESLEEKKTISSIEVSKSSMPAFSAAKSLEEPHSPPTEDIPKVSPAPTVALDSTSKTLDEKIKNCLSRYEALPEKYKFGSFYLNLVSTIVHHLPAQDPLKKELDEIITLENQMSRPDSPLYMGESKIINNELFEEKNSPKRLPESENKGLNPIMVQPNDEYMQSRNLLNQKYTSLTEKVKKRFQRFPIPCEFEKETRTYSGLRATMSFDNLHMLGGKHEELKPPQEVRISIEH